MLCAAATPIRGSLLPGHTSPPGMAAPGGLCPLPASRPPACQPPPAAHVTIELRSSHQNTAGARWAASGLVSQCRIAQLSLQGLQDLRGSTNTGTLSSLAAPLLLLLGINPCQRGNPCSYLALGWAHGLFSELVGFIAVYAGTGYSGNKRNVTLVMCHPTAHPRDIVIRRCLGLNMSPQLSA
jgi:hypothetical protein